MFELILVVLIGGIFFSVVVMEVIFGVGCSYAISRLGVGVYILFCTMLYVGFRGLDK